MRVAKIDDMKGGWFVGEFEPTLHRTSEVEVAIKEYPAGGAEPLHHHKVATELTAIVSGSAEMQGRRLQPGDVAVLSPGESAEFSAITDVVLVAVKLPSVAGDKYVEPQA